jgi:type I restriction-modification system DNA methylase subunit
VFSKNNIVHFLKKIASSIAPITMHEFSNCLILLIFYKAITHHRGDLFNNEMPLALFISNNELFQNITNHPNFDTDFLGVILEKIQREYGLDLIKTMPEVQVEKMKQVMAFVDDMSADICEFAEYQEFLQEVYENLLARYGDRGTTNAEFHTPYQVSDLMARILKQRRDADVVYDFACGSGSLLIGALSQSGCGLVIGRDLNANVLNISRINLALAHARVVDIEQADSLATTQEAVADWIVANPPFSVQASQYPNFDTSYTPLVADWLFVLQGLKSLKDGGCMAIILPTGALFRKNDSPIRKMLVESGQVAGVVVLPRKLFKNTPVQTCIVVFDKDGKNDSLAMVDVSDDNFVLKKHMSGYVMRDDAMTMIEDAFLKKCTNEVYAKQVSITDIAVEDFDLMPQFYLDASKLSHRPFAETFDECLQLDAKISVASSVAKHKILKVKNA